MPPVVQHGKTVSGTWASTFPENQESEADSLLFMKRFLYVAFSQIIYMRELLPKNCFKKRKCDNLRLQVFNTTIADAFEVADQLRAVCETIDKGYLREFHLNIFDEKRRDDEVIEVYKMGFSYGDDKHRPSVSISSNEMDRADIKYDGKDALREQTRALLVKIHNITNHLAELPETMKWSFYIVYVDEKTPKGYQARTFQRRPEPYLLAEDAQNVIIGQTSANHHACQLQVSSVYIEDSMEFSAMIEGELSNIQQGWKADSKDTSMEDARNVNDSFDLPEKKTPESENSVERGRRVKAGGGVVELEKAAQKMNIEDKADRISASSPEEKQTAQRKTQSPKKKRNAKEKSASPSKVLKTSKAIRRTPGNTNSRSSIKRKGRQ